VILYRHFDSKAALYRAVLERACERLAAETGTDDFDDDAIPALLRAASADPDGFRLLFRYAAREPEFREFADLITAASTEIAQKNLATLIPDGPWLEWASRLIPTLTIEAMTAWLDAGRPEPDQAPERIRQAIHGVIDALQPTAKSHQQENRLQAAATTAGPGRKF
jgi:AcrR family transcriptional regulator